MNTTIAFRLSPHAQKTSSYSIDTLCQPIVYKNIPPFMPSHSKVRRFTALNWLDDLWNAITGRLLPSPEPKAFQMYDRLGQIWWYVYNPVTGESNCFHSEDEVLHWFDQRFS